MIRSFWLSLLTLSAISIRWLSLKFPLSLLWETRALSRQIECLWLDHWLQRKMPWKLQSLTQGRKSQYDFCHKESQQDFQNLQMHRDLESGDFLACLESATQSFLECPPSQLDQILETRDRAHGGNTCQWQVLSWIQDLRPNHSQFVLYAALNFQPW